MARKTFYEIRLAGAKLGGNDSVDDWIATKLNGWLRKHYAQYPWPFLNTQAVSVPIAAGATSLEVGAGLASITNQIVRVFGPVYWRDQSSATNRGKANITQLLNQSIDAVAAAYDSNVKGAPLGFTYVESQDSAGLKYVTITPFPRPDKAYYLTFFYQRLPDDLTYPDSALVSQVPLYPNELTLIQAAKCAAIEYDNSNTQWFKEESDILAQMVSADRDAYGGNASYGDKMQLDPVNFGSEDSPSNKLPWS